MKTKITHIITSLLLGGAEKVLLRLVQGTDKDHFDHEVIALTSVGPLAAEFEKAGVKIRVIGFHKGIGSFKCFFDLIKAVRASQPNVVQTWLYHGDLLGGVAARLGTGAPIIWNLRQSNLDDHKSTKSTVLIAKACAHLSRLIPHKIVCGSQSARRVHVDLGYLEKKMIVIENGFDVQRFHHDVQKAKVFRQHFNVAEGTILIGHAGRFDPQKDHLSLLQAIKRVVVQTPHVKAVLCGTNVIAENDFFRETIARLDLKEHVILAGVVDDMTAFYSAMDVLVLSSAYGEGGPNVLGEAMACETVCIATDVGDSARIVGDSNRIVPPQQSDAMGDAILKMLNEPLSARKQMGVLARKRIVEEFPLDKMVVTYQNVYQTVSRPSK